jgi:hypothetical protein
MSSQFFPSAEMPCLRQGSRVYSKRCEGFRRHSAKTTAQARGEFVWLASTKKLVADEPVSRILRGKLQTNKLFRINQHYVSKMSVLVMWAGLASHRRHNFVIHSFCAKFPPMLMTWNRAGSLPSAPVGILCPGQPLSRGYNATRAFCTTGMRTCANALRRVRRLEATSLQLV